MQEITSELDCELLIDEMVRIFKAKILKNEKQLLSGYPPLSLSNKNIINTGFQIYIILTILKENVPESPKLEKFDVLEVNDSGFSSIQSRKRQIR